MAGQQQATQQQGGLPPISASVDANNLPLYGQSDEYMQNLQDEQQKLSDALEHRYDNPNWMNVAAGFLKPQLGGFAASLGSAAEALGQNTEEQRNNVLSSSDLKLKLLQNQMMLGANKKAADLIQNWHTKNPGMLAMPPEVLSEYAKGAPNSPLIAKEQQNWNDQIARAKDLQSSGGNLTDNQRALLKGTSGNSSTQNNAPVSQPVDNGQGQSQNFTQGLNPATVTPERLAILKAQPDWDEKAFQDSLSRFQDNMTKPDGSTQPPQKQDTTIYPPTIKKMDDSGTFGNVNAKGLVDAHNAAVEVAEQPFRDQYTNAASVVAGPNYTQENAARTNLLSLIQQNPQLTQKIVGLVRSSPFLTALDEGVKAGAAGIHMDVGLPVSAVSDSNLSDPEKAFKDKLINLVNQVSQSDAKLNGTVAGKVPQQEYMKSFGSYINKDMSPATLENAAMSSKVNLDQKRDWYNQMTDEMSKHVSQDSQTPFADVAKNSPAIAKINKKYGMVNDILQKNLQSKINPNGATP